MLLREQYQEHSERDYLSVPLATYHFEQVTIPLHWHREVELILPQEAGELELEGQLHPYGPQELLCVNQGVLHRTWAPIPLADLLVVDLDSLLSPLLRQDGGSFLTRLAEGELGVPPGRGAGTPRPMGSWRRPSGPAWVWCGRSPPAGSFPYSWSC